MKTLKVLLFGLLLAVPVFADETDDRKTATSLKYVTHELDTRQNKLETGTNQAITYTNAAGGIEQRTVKSDLAGGSTSDTSLPTVGAVTDGLSHKQDEIDPINDHTAVTYTGQTGEISTKGIYQVSGMYADQSDNLIDAKTFNAALKNGLDSEFVCSENRSPDDICWLWEIHNGGINSALPAGYTPVEYVRNKQNTYINTGVIPDVDDMEFEVEVQPSTGSWYILQARDSINIYGISGSVNGNTIGFAWRGASLTSSIVRNTTHTYYVKATAKNGVATLYVRDLTDGTTDMKTASYNSTQTTDQPICIWGNTTGNLVQMGNQVHYARVKKSGQFVINYVPAIYNNANGFYDTVSGSFETATSGSIVAGPEISDNIYIPQNRQ